MGAITIHLREELETKVREASADAGVSVSAWLSEAASEKLMERLPPTELARWFGAFPELELPTRTERWSKVEP